MSALSIHEFVEIYTRQYQNCLLIDVQLPWEQMKLTGAIKRSHLGTYLKWDHIDHAVITELLMSLSDCRTTVADYFIFYDEQGSTDGESARLAMLIDYYSNKQSCFVTGGIESVLKHYPHLIDNPSNTSNEILELRREQLNLVQQVWYPLKSQVKDYPRLIINNLYLSGKDGASFDNLQKFEIDVVIRIGFFDELSDSCVYHSYPLEDTSHEKIDSIFEETSNIIHDAYLQNKRVLVHCHAGVSRSSTIILHYMMKNLHFTLKDAFDHTFKQRPIVRPNEGFAMTLQKYELLLSKDIDTPTLDVCFMSYDYNIYREYLEFKMRMNSIVDEAINI
eukprot:NODE_750_length_4577_cov_0.299687.p1 type:complete len:334 gc:universal NODE_750_length_4577_cov_0.299687:2829-1828(-)